MWAGADGRGVTFSITATDGARTGVAVASVFPSVGAVCPWVSDRVALSTQSWDAGATYGEPALDMLDDDLTLPTAAEALVEDRAGGAGTQLHGIEAGGRSFTYTGDRCVDWAGHEAGEDHTVAGNTLAGPDVVAAMSDAFAAADGPFTERLLTALDAVEAAGGDKRGDNLSAAVLVHAEEPKLYHNLRVDRPGDPIEGLWAGYEAGREAEEGDDTERVREAWGETPPESVTEFPIRY